MTTQGKVFLWGGLTLILVLIVWGIMAAPSTPTTSSSVPGMSDADHVRGSKTAKVVLIEYSDFQCPACKQAEPMVTRLTEKYGDRLVFVYRHFPLRQTHPNAQLAAQASEAAHQQGKFWEFHDLLFDRQSSWSRSSSSSVKNTFAGYAGELGLNTDQFKSELDERSVKDRVEVDVRSGTAANVSGTPTFFLNGKQITTSSSFDAFSKLIDDALAANTNS